MSISKEHYLDMQERYFDARESLSGAHLELIDLRGYSWPDNAAGGPEWLRTILFIKDALRVVGGEINWFGEQIKSCEAWSSVHDSLSTEDQIETFYFLMKDSFTLVLLTPYALKQRFVFFVSHMLHYTRMVMDTTWKESSFPADKKININTLRAFNQPLFNSVQAFLYALDQLDSSDSQDDLLEFRNKYQHRDPVHVEHGLSATIKRERVDSDSTSYGLGGTKPLPMKKAIEVARDQHECALNCHKAMLTLFDELLEVWRKERPYKDYC